ncbi:MAG TPA: cation:proton antiporter [Candidatus Limnocylindria bacterium]|nr:cation:proton antiporter [Candidatus Limnocylindria bacterium]
MDLVLAIVAAFIGGLAAQRLGQPVIVGYLIAGVALGPFTPGPVASAESVGVIAEIGVAFLMFALGAEFSRAELRGMGRVAVVGGTLQIAGTIAVGLAIGLALGLTPVQGVFLGALLALSSTVVAIKVLAARGALQSLHGRGSVAVLIAQDLAVVPMIVLLPALGLPGAIDWAGLLLTIAKAAGVVLVAYLLGARAAPWLLAHAAARPSREVFLLAVVALALGTALMTQYVGLSLAFGAFLAGVVIAESEYRTQVIAEVLPLRDLFTSLFFVSVGMLIDPIALLAALGPLALLTVAVVVAKPAVTTLALLLAGLPGVVALPAALAIAQVGEFSFVLARQGVETGAIPPRVFDLTLATALVTIVLAPALVRLSGPALSALRRVPGLRDAFAEPLDAGPPGSALRRHVVICGYGGVGRELAAVLGRRGFAFVVVEYNPAVVRQLRQEGARAIYGDAANPAVLEHARLAEASLLAVLVPDPQTAEVATRHARSMNPRLDIIARAARPEDVERLRRAGATDVVQPQFEAGVEVIRHALRRFGISGAELATLAAGRRASFYGGS